MNDKEHRNLERAGKADTDRILTIPNVLSFFRLALIPVIIVLYAKNEVWWAFGMLVLSGVTDVVDGWVARTYHMVSNFGKAIDPVADKLTQIAVLLCLMPMKCWWVVVPDDETDRSPCRFSFVNTGKELYFVVFLAWGCDFGLSRFTAVQFTLDKCRI